MVEIVSRKMQPLPQPNYTGYSRGSRADMSGKIMGQGFSNVINQLAGVGEYMIQEDMQDTVSSAVAELDKQLGLDTQQTSGPTNIIPDAVKTEYATSLSSLSAAKTQGKISQEEYIMRLREVQKGLLAKYPGASAEISTIFRQKTGMDPAIKAREVLFKQQAAANAAIVKEKQDFARLFQNAIDKGVLNPKEAELLFKESMSDPEKMQENKVLLYKKLSVRGQIEAEKSFLELQAKRGKIEQQQVEKVTNKLAADYTRNFLDGSLKAATGSYSVAGLRKLVETYTKDGVVDPNEQKNLEMLAFKLQEGYKAGLMKILYEPSEKGGKSLAEMLGPEGVRKFVDDQVNTFVSNFVTPLTGKKVQVDLFEMNKRTVDAVENFSALSVYKSSKVAQTITGLKKIFGPNYGLILKNNPDYLKLLRKGGDFGDVWVQFNFGEALNNGTPIADAFRKNADAYNDNPEKASAANKATLRLAIETFSNKDLSPEGRLKSGRFLFSDPDLLSKIKPEERQKLYDELVNPETVKAASQLAKQDPTFGENFADFVTRSSTIVLKRQFEEVKTNAETLGAKLLFEKGKFTIDDSGMANNETFYGGGGFVPGLQTNNKVNEQLIEMQVERLNQKLETLSKALRGVGANGNKFVERLSFAYIPEAFPSKQGTEDTQKESPLENNKPNDKQSYIEQPQGKLDTAALSPYEMKGSSPEGREEQTYDTDATTKAAVDAIKKFEGFRTKAYRDSKGVWTVGYGFTKGVKPGTVISRQEAEQRLAEELKHFSNGVKSAVKPEVWGKLSPKQQAALISLAYNIGTGRFKKSTLVRKLNRGDINGAAKEFLKWTKIRKNGRLIELKGLRNRRNAEYKMFLSG